MARTMRYQPALDGIRGLAIAAVVAFHADERVFKGGHLGVTIFFVLSGYLITTLLMCNHSGESRLRTFYRRRAARLLPALVVNLAVGAAAYQMLGYSLGGVLPSLVYVANLRDVLTGNGPHTDPFFYCWSLSIEEQFYLLWPAFLLFAMQRRPRLVPIVAGAAIVWALVERAAIAGIYPLHAAISTETRMDAVLVGCVLAWVLQRSRRHLPEPAAWAGLLVLLGLTVVGAQGAMTYTYWVPVCEAASSAIIWVVVTRPEGAAARALGWPPLAWLGRISYSLYLYNVVVRDVLVHRLGDTTAVACLVVVAAVAVAWISFVVIERPARSLINSRSAEFAAGHASSSPTAVPVRPALILSDREA